MVVPHGRAERYGAAVGKREGKYSLETKDDGEVGLRHTKKLAEMLRHMARLNAPEATAVGDRADAIVAQGMTALARSTIIHQALIGPNFDTARGLDNRPVELQSGRIVRRPADAGRDGGEGRSGQNRRYARRHRTGAEARRLGVGILKRRSHGGC